MTKTTSTKTETKKVLTETEQVAKILEILPQMQDWEKQPTSIEHVHMSKFPKKGSRVERAMITLDLPDMQKDVHISSEVRLEQFIAIFGNAKNQKVLRNMAKVFDKAVGKLKNEPAPLLQEHVLF